MHTSVHKEPNQSDDDDSTKDNHDDLIGRKGGESHVVVEVFFLRFERVKQVVINTKYLQ